MALLYPKLVYLAALTILEMYEDDAPFAKTAGQHIFKNNLNDVRNFPDVLTHEH